MVQTGRIANAYLFYGRAGSFLDQAAYYLGLSLLCTMPSSSPSFPCLSCDECKRVLSGNSLHFRFFDESGKWGVDKVRDLQQAVQYGADRPGGRLIVVVKPADTFTTEAGNAFLKTLEEPPLGVTFILLSYLPLMVLPTIRSRCQTLDFPLGDQDAYLASLSDEKRDMLDQQAFNQPELSQYAYEFDYQLPFPFRSLSEVVAMDWLARLNYAQEMGMSKDGVILILSIWLRESQSLGGKFLDIQEKLIATSLDMKYNVNLRLQLEQFLLSLPS